MSPEKVLAALRACDARLAELGAPVKQFAPEEYDLCGLSLLAASDYFSHCRWMIRHCLEVFKIEFEAEWSRLPAMMMRSPHELVAWVTKTRKPLEKSMRWLCYVQGVCNVLGVYTCNQLRDQSRGGAGEFKTPAEEHV